MTNQGKCGTHTLTVGLQPVYINELLLGGRKPSIFHRRSGGNITREKQPFTFLTLSWIFYLAFNKVWPNPGVKSPFQTHHIHPFRRENGGGVRPINPFT